MSVRQPLVLAALLRQQIDAENISITHLAARLGVAQSYLSELLSGDKSFERLNDERLRAVAHYLRIPALVAFMLAGRLRPEDFVEQSLEPALAITSLPQTPLALKSRASEIILNSLPKEAKLLLKAMYQQEEIFKG